MIADGGRMIKFHVSTAIRVVTSSHVAEILRDAAPKVMLYPTHLIATLLDHLLHRENTSQKLPSPPIFTSENWVRTRGSMNGTPIDDVASSRHPPARNELYIHGG